MEAGWSHVTSMMEVDGGGQLMQMDLGMTMSRDAALVAAHPLHWAPDTQQYKPTQLSNFLPRLSDTDFTKNSRQ